MTEYEKYYTENLYPFQDGILSIAKRINAPFYLTGGTALSRYYKPVRYSDDLDLFVNMDAEFPAYCERFFRELDKESRKGAFNILSDRVARYENYVQLFVERQPQTGRPITLKIDLVNDVASHYGNIELDETLGRIDSWRNILSNKISALYRLEAKDLVDLWTLSKIKSFNWREIIREASSKEAGTDSVLIYELLKSFPGSELSSIKWISPKPKKDSLLQDIKIMAEDIFEGLDNSLHSK